PRLKDVARQFVIDDGADDPAARVTNEIDVAILRDNTLYLVECKTGMAGRSKGAADAIYKLAQLVAQLGGLRGRGIFVTSELLSPPIKARAQALSIAIIDRSALGQLAVALKTALVQGAPLTSPAQPSGQSRDDLHGDLRPATR
ncbi:MAG: DUF1887 family CARF protein, partial [Rhodocyclaceae bacterium]|nr:DUF1887 family CARF protein [Rhodocyclaceae bacterium]